MSRKVQFEFDPFELTGIAAPEGADKDEILEEVGQYVVEEILSYCAEHNSPVAGHGRFPALSKQYKRRKQDAGRPGVPDLVFDGDMLDALNYSSRSSTVRVGVERGKESDKADGHCNISGDSKLPLRRFIPDEGETFKKPIIDGIARIIRAHS